MGTSIDKVLSENLRFYLSRTGKMQKEFADYVGVTQGTISQWIHGTGFPQMDRIDRICAFLGITRAELVTERHGFITKRLTEAEDRFLAKYNELNIDGKQKLEEHADLLIASGQYKKGMTLVSNL